MDSNDKQLTERFSFRISPELSVTLARKANRTELSKADYVRQAIMDKAALDDMREALSETERTA